MPYLFDTDAISELLRSKPAPRYVEWVRGVPREDQYTSAVVIGELFKGAFRSKARDRHLRNIEDRVLPAVTALPYDVATARVYGQCRARLEEEGALLPDADLQIAATAIYHGLELVTGNVRHFRRVPGLSLNTILADARGRWWEPRSPRDWTLAAIRTKDQRRRITTVHYLSRKALGLAGAREQIHALLRLFELAPVTRAVIEGALDLRLPDFEDAVLHESGRDALADGIVTRHAGGFEKGGLRVYEPGEPLGVLDSL